MSQGNANGDLPMRISPQYNVNDWLKLTFSTEDEWQEAIEMLEDRIRGRFLDIIHLIEGEIYAGFAVLALDCLLIETLQQFREGVSETPRGQSKSYFTSFLTEGYFGQYFDEKMAIMFYRQIRCGILHQAEVKGSSRVLIRWGTPLVKYTNDRKGLVINRKLFHQQLIQEFEDYINRLREPSNQELRGNFKKKMDYICKAFGELGRTNYV